MRVLLIDFDSKIPNLALMKISAWHKQQGDIVGFDTPNPEKIYLSTIFTKSKSQVNGIKTMYPNVEFDIGGTGYDIKKQLPQEIELIKPDYSLYPSEYSQGFTTRGCVRKCKFCFVPEKEGKIHTGQHPCEFHDNKFDTCMIMDNNLLAAPDFWIRDVLSWFINNKIKMLSPQGWDARLLTPSYARLLKEIKHAGQVHFAWDNIKDEEKIKASIDILKEVGFNLRSQITYYVLVGFSSTFEDDLYRCEKLKEWGTNAFVMKYHKRDKNLNNLARWANKKWLYWSIPFNKYNGGKK